MRLAQPEKGGKGTVGDTVAALAERGIRHHLDAGPDMPAAALPAWEWFLDLSRGRQTGMGLCPIAWEAIRAWADLRGITLTRLDLDLIRAFDAAFLTVHAPPPPKEPRT